MRLTKQLWCWCVLLQDNKMISMMSHNDKSCHFSWSRVLYSRNTSTSMTDATVLNTFIFQMCTVWLFENQSKQKQIKLSHRRLHPLHPLHLPPLPLQQLAAPLRILWRLLPPPALGPKPPWSLVHWGILSEALAEWGADTLLPRTSNPIRHICFQTSWSVRRHTGRYGMLYSML